MNKISCIFYLHELMYAISVDQSLVFDGWVMAMEFCIKLLVGQ